MCDFILWCLCSVGYVVIVVVDGEQVFDFYDVLEYEVDVVVIDILMFNKDGVLLVCELKECCFEFKMLMIFGQKSVVD